MVLLLISQSVFASLEDATIYGQDDRQEVVDVDLIDLSRGVVVALPSQYTWQLPLVNAPTLEARFRVCRHERFSFQPSIGACTGIHVGDGLVLTAAHCVRDELSCEKFSWAFNYRTDVIGESAGALSINDVFKCEKIVLTDKKNDLTLLKLEKAAKRYPHMPLRFNAPRTERIFAIGSPLGLPLKFSGMGRLTAAHTASLDVFTGNSGSPILNEQRQVIGLLLGGHEDFSVTERGCRESFVLEESRNEETIFPLSTLPARFKKYIRRAQ
jgi:S1-C subfamily serine protease